MHACCHSGRGSKAVAVHGVVQVLVAKVFRLEVRHALDSKAELSPGILYVEVTARAAEGEHATACEAIGAQSKLLNLVWQLELPDLWLPSLCAVLMPKHRNLAQAGGLAATLAPLCELHKP